MWQWCEMVCEQNHCNTTYNVKFASDFVLSYLWTTPPVSMHNLWTRGAHLSSMRSHASLGVKPPVSTGSMSLWHPFWAHGSACLKQKRSVLRLNHQWLHCWRHPWFVRLRFLSPIHRCVFWRLSEAMKTSGESTNGGFNELINEILLMRFTN